MKALLTFSLNNYGLLVLTAAGAVLTLVVLCLKRRYVNEGVLFRRLPAEEHEVQGEKMRLDNHIDLEIALRKFHELGLESGDSGYAYWHEVGRLLKQAAGMQSRIHELSKELEQCRARLGKAD
ncbi:hypothetical protein [Caballeronia telluris]|uniref:Uncharacterized protein n=1 Tax=Caballeronia telluris TaxID=326475 RepID=A0A158KCM1_9BURK|nr:hypothetical protein [Caballeronia telluris]SAL78872.1 hypothetical protein AWB66_05934 [Caballeronia telluris]